MHYLITLCLFASLNNGHCGIHLTPTSTIFLMTYVGWTLNGECNSNWARNLETQCSTTDGVLNFCLGPYHGPSNSFSYGTWILLNHLLYFMWGNLTTAWSTGIIVCNLGSPLYIVIIKATFYCMKSSVSCAHISISIYVWEHMSAWYPHIYCSSSNNVAASSQSVQAIYLPANYKFIENGAFGKHSNS